MSIPLSENPLRDFDISGDLISDETIAVPVSSPYKIYPEFTCQKNSPSTTEIWTSVNKTGTQYTEKTDEDLVAVSGDFFCNYNRGGLLTFHSSAAGLSLRATYLEVGTFMRVEDINDLRDIIGSGEISDRNGNTNLTTHANDDTIHLTSESELASFRRHSGDPGAHPNFFYKPGQLGGQIAHGGTNPSDNLVLMSTSNATLGKIQFGSGDAASAYDETNLRLGIGTKEPATILHTSGDTVADIRAEAKTGWAGFSIIAAGISDDKIAYIWSDANENFVRFNQGTETKIRIFGPEAGLDVSGDIRTSGELKFATSQPGIRASGDINIYSNLDMNSRMISDLAMPSVSGDVANKQYVDNQATAGTGWVDDGTIIRLVTSTDKVGIGTANPTAKLDISGDVRTSTELKIASSPSIIRSSGDLEIYPANTISVTGHRIISLATPTVSGDAANKKYVDENTVTLSLHSGDPGAHARLDVLTQHSGDYVSSHIRLEILSQHSGDPGAHDNYVSETELSQHSGDVGAHSQLTILTQHSGDPSAHPTLLSTGQKDDLTDSGDSIQHYHSSDRARANHTGTQTRSTISDFSHGGTHYSSSGDALDIKDLADSQDRLLSSGQKTDLTDSGDSIQHYHSSDRSRANHTGTQSRSTILDFGHGGTHWSGSGDVIDVKDIADSEGRLLTGTQKTDLTDGGQTTLHAHAGISNGVSHINVEGQSQISGDIVFKDDGIAVLSQSGQNITMTVPDIGRVRRINASGQAQLSGDVIIEGLNRTTISQSGQTIQVSSPDFNRVTSIKAQGESDISGDAVLVAGSNVTLTQVGQNITIASTGGAGTSGVQHLNIEGQTQISGDIIFQDDGIVVLSQTVRT